MCGSKLLCLCLVLCASLAFTSAKPVDDILNLVAEKLLPTDVKSNGSNLSNIPMITAVSRQALYPIPNGLGYHNLQQLTLPSSHYPTGWPYAMQQTPLWSNNMQFKDDQHTEARTLGHLRPSLYSQYQTISPQSYNYLFEKPVLTYSNIEGISQPQMYQSMPMLISKEAPAHSQFRDADSADAQFPSRGADIMIDNQYNMQIPQDLLLQKLQGLSAPQMSAVPQHEMLVQPQMSRAAEHSQLQTTEYIPSMFQNPQANFKSLEINQQIQDPYVTPQDQVYIEPSFIPEASHVQGFRAAELEDPTWYNYRQQLRMAEMKGYYNAMQGFASHLEVLDRNFIKEHEMMGKSSESTSSRKEQLINTDTMKNNEQMQQISEKKSENSKLTQGKDVSS